MNNSILLYKKRYLACIIPALFISACNSGKQTNTSSNQSGPLPVTPTTEPSTQPSSKPSTQPTTEPSTQPSSKPSTTPSTPPNKNNTIFFAGNNGKGYNGDLLHQAESMGATSLTTGIQGADFICNSEAKKPVWHPNIPSGESHTYKAIIVDGLNRIACTSNNCSTGTNGQTDWVLQPNTTYLSESGSKIGQTNESAIFVFPTLVSFDYGSPVATTTTWVGHGDTPYTVYAHNIMTGLQTNWTSSNINCQKWTSPSVDELNLTGDLSLMAYFYNSEITTVQFSNNNSVQINAHKSNSQVPCNSSHTLINDKGQLTAYTQGIICVEQN